VDRSGALEQHPLPRPEPVASEEAPGALGPGLRHVDDPSLPPRTDHLPPQHGPPPRLGTLASAPDTAIPGQRRPARRSTRARRSGSNQGPCPAAAFASACSLRAVRRDRHVDPRIG